MKQYMLLFVLFVLIFASGCVSETGQVTREDSFEEETALRELNDMAESGRNETPAPVENVTKDNTGNQTSNQTKPAKTVTTNEKVVCSNVTKACPDGSNAVCQRCCLKAKCTSCEPDCSGHNVCVEDWSCSEWSDCSGDLQVRICEDEASCGTDLNRPDEIIDCDEETQLPQEEQQVTITFNEIMYNPSQNENYNEWIEFFNPMQFSVNLTSWMLCNKKILPGYLDYYTGEIKKDEGMVLGPLSFALITDSGDNGTQVYSNFNVSQGSLALRVDAGSLCGGLANSGNKTIYINDSSGNSVENMKYYNLASEGYSIERSGDIWNSSITENGTPGYANSAY